jgi:hypothetical protein
MPSTTKPMNTTIDGKQYTATKHKDGTITLTPVVAEAPKSTPRCGDVWMRGDYGFLVTDAYEKYVFTIRTGQLVDVRGPRESDCFLLNIFDFAKGEYVKKSDVVAALSHKDRWGESVLHGANCQVHSQAVSPTRKALAELGITAEGGAK